MSSSKGSKGLRVVKGRQCSSKNVSLSALSKHDQLLISGLKVEPKQPSRDGSAKAVCWNYFGCIKFSQPDFGFGYGDRALAHSLMAETKAK